LKKTAVVILNFNGQNWLEKFLPTFILHSNEADIVIIDNGSTDESVKFINKEYPQLDLIKLKSNLGFAGGYNEGLKQLNHSYFIIVNSDIEVTENWISPNIKILESDENIVAVQPKIKSYLEKSKFEHAGAAGGWIDKLGFPLCRGRVIDAIETDNNQYDDTNEIFWASGACLFVKAKDFFEQGGFDSTFFAHMEEIDLCWRWKNNGKSIVFSGQSTVYHVGGGTLNYNSPQKVFLNHRNNLYMIHKNYKSKLPFGLLILIRLFLDGLACLKYTLSGKPRFIISIIKAHFAYYIKIRDLNSFRKNNKFNDFKRMKGVLNSSIIWKYYVLQKRKFVELIK
jgi:GT2 family glycosyltransferase